MSALLDAQAQLELLERARAGDHAALDALLADFRPVAFAAAVRALSTMGLGADHAEDALQIAAVRFITRGLAAYRGSATPRAYFARIAVNAAIDTARLLSRTRSLDALLDPSHAGERETPLSSALSRTADAEAQLSHAELARALEACVDALAPHYRESVTLYYYEERGDCSTCAAAAGVQRNAFMQRLSRARGLLAECLRRKLRGEL
ncbi:MAG: RNA polymerase sigma factor [Myxococcales bacterium]|nr:RNA polymerase sigma factor [Myxococcales bacterium]